MAKTLKDYLLDGGVKGITFVGRFPSIGGGEMEYCFSDITEDRNTKMRIYIEEIQDFHYTELHSHLNDLEQLAESEKASGVGVHPNTVSL